MDNAVLPDNHKLHVFLFPFMIQSHILPMVDVARLFSARGLKSTIITTPLNAINISKTTERAKLSGLDINVKIIAFPGVEVGLPEGIERLEDITSPEMIPKFFRATAILRQPFYNLLEEQRPDFVVADMFLLWATEAAAKFGIPQISFPVTGLFSLCVEQSLAIYKPYETISSDHTDESSTSLFMIPGLPDKIEMSMAELPNHSEGSKLIIDALENLSESDLNGYGVLVNSFYDLEPAYAEHYRNALGRKAWYVGPVSLHNEAERGEKSTIDEHYVLKWLDSKDQNSVLYVSFGTTSRVNNSHQLLELAMGLESSGCSFIWVVRKINKDDEESFLSSGFEERIQGKGLIVRDWAPQVEILNHQAVGGFMTQCGWNSVLEGISAGVPMITWPLFAEQFYTEKFITQVIKIGTPLGPREYNFWLDAKDVSLVKKEKIQTVVSWLMGDGEEVQEMRKRAKKISEMAKKSVELGGSSYGYLSSLIEEMKIYTKK
ncbi:hypothetical protein MKW92_014514 [Papaver armeniacum]|nr:hypothetical protein MKW92_014514 [Papaver armeniacum]